MSYTSKDVSILAAKLRNVEKSLIEQAISDGTDPAIKVCDILNPLRARLFMALEQSKDLREKIESLYKTCRSTLKS